MFITVLFVAIFTSFSKIKIKKKSQNSRSPGFLTSFARWLKDPDPGPYLVQMDPEPGGPKTYGSYGSGSQHCCFEQKFRVFNSNETFLIYQWSRLRSGSASKFSKTPWFGFACREIRKPSEAFTLCLISRAVDLDSAFQVIRKWIRKWIRIWI